MIDGRDPWFFQRWAYGVTTGNPIRKSVLMVLAVLADSTTGRCEAKQDTLAQWVEAGDRAVRGHLKALEESGMIARRAQFRTDRGRRSDEILLLAPGITAWPDGEPVQPAPGSGGAGMRDPHPPERTGTPPGVSSVPGKNDHQRTTTENDHASKQEASHAHAHTQGGLPDDFPEALLPHARIVYSLLRAVAAQHNAREVSPLALGRVMMGRPRKPFVRAAHDFAAWAADPPRPVKDVVTSYRTWLDNARTPTLVGIERLDEDGTPAEAVTRAAVGSASTAKQERDRRRIQSMQSLGDQG